MAALGGGESEGKHLETIGRGKIKISSKLGLKIYTKGENDCLGDTKSCFACVRALQLCIFDKKRKRGTIYPHLFRGELHSKNDTAALRIYTQFSSLCTNIIAQLRIMNEPFG